jgi:hypothetical protein
MTSHCRTSSEDAVKVRAQRTNCSLLSPLDVVAQTWHQRSKASPWQVLEVSLRRAPSWRT